MAYTPTPNTIKGMLLPHLDQVSLRTTALKPLELDTVFPRFLKSDDMAAGNGQIAMWYRPNNLTTPTLPIATTNEGSVGTSLQYSTRTVQVKMLNFSDYITIGSQVTDISMVNDLQDAAGRLGYYFSLVYDLNIRNVIDFHYTGMARTPLNTYMSIRDLRSGRHYLRNRGVQKPAGFGNEYPVIMSPLVSYDLLSDPDVGSYGDLVKQQGGVSNTLMLKYPDAEGGDSLGSMVDCKIYESNNVYSGTDSNGNTVYSTYMLGDEAFGKVEFTKRPAMMKPNSNMGIRFNIYMEKLNKPSLPDPTQQFGGFCSANFWTGAECLATNEGYGLIGGGYRGIQWRHQSTIS